MFISGGSGKNQIEQKRNPELFNNTKNPQFVRRSNAGGAMLQGYFG